MGLGQSVRKSIKLGVSFHEAAILFGDTLALTCHDPEHSVEEQRFITVGVSNAGQHLIVAYADRDGSISIISALQCLRMEASIPGKSSSRAAPPAQPPHSQIHLTRRFSSSNQFGMIST